MLRSCPLLLALASSLAAALPAAADVVTLPASKDASIFDDGVGLVASGAAKSLYAGHAGTMTSTPVRRALLAFDVAAAIPAGATIQSAQLVLHVSNSSSPAATFELRRLVSDWSEGPTVGFSGSGGPAQAGDVTWLHRSYPGTLWTTAGGDFVPTASAAASMPTSGYCTFASTPALVADVQLWLDTPSQAFGWILTAPETGPKNARGLDARNSDVVAFRPALTIHYTPPPPPPASSYCTAKTNSLGCVPAIGFTGVPDADAGSGFVIAQANALNNKSGLLFYGTNGPKAAPFQGGTMCVHAPTIRTPIQFSGGSPSGSDCTGTFAYDFNARIVSGADPFLIAGAQVWAQYWSRDPGATFTTSLSDGLTFVIQP